MSKDSSKLLTKTKNIGNGDENIFLNSRPVSGL